MVKKLAIGAAILLSVGMSAGVTSAHVCYARGGTGATGWGSGSLSYARRRALAECAVRTPRGYMCYITGCR